MDFILLVLIIAIIMFLILIYKANKNGIDVWQNINDLVMYSFAISISVFGAISLIIYAVFGKMIFGLTYEFIRLGILIGGVTLLFYEAKTVYEKLNKKK